LKKRLVLVVPMLLALVLAAAAHRQSDPAPAEAATINPIILVHGFTGTPSSMNTLKSRFEAQGRQAFAIDYTSENNVTNAQALATFINSVKAQTGASQVDLVGHSMGGLSTRYYIKRLNGAGNIAQYVSLGTPQYGVWSACLLLTSYGGQMCPTSSFLKDLNSGDDTVGSLLYTTIYSTSDGTVPTSSSRLDGGACFKQVSGVSHSGLLTDQGVFDAALAAVDGTCPGTFQ